MVSVFFFVTILSALVAFSGAEEAATTSQGTVHTKRFMTVGMGGLGFTVIGNFFSGSSLALNPWLYSWNRLGAIYGYGLFNSYLATGGLGGFGFFVKATDNANLSRRAVSLNAEQLYRHDSRGTVSCTTEMGETAIFVTQDCINAARKMSERKSSSASCNSCTLSLVSDQDRMVPTHMPADVLEKAARGVLKACSNPALTQNARRSPVVDNSKSKVAIILSKGENAAC